MSENTDSEPPSWDERQQAFDRLLAGDDPAAEADILEQLGIAA